MISNYINDKKYHSQICSNIFQADRLWKNKQVLVDCVNEYAQITGFTLNMFDINTIKCNRGGKNKTSRNLSSGALKCDCSWQIKFVSIVKTKTESKCKGSNKTYTRNKDNFDDTSPVKITKTSCYDHKLPCNPSGRQQLFTNKTAGKYVHHLSEYATFTLCALLKENPKKYSFFKH